MNKNKKRSVLLAGMCLSVALGVTAFTGCDFLGSIGGMIGIGGNSSSSEVQKGSLTFEVKEEITIGYYEYCTVPVVVATDDSGNTYFPKTVVKDSAGKVIALEDGKFFVTQETDYTFEYTLTWNDETITKKTTAKVADLTAPSVTPASSELSAFTDSEVEVPAVELDDNRDTEEQLSVEVKVKYGDQEITVTDNKFVPTQAGVYNVEYTVTDRAGNVATKIVPVYVIAKVDGEISYFYENGSIGFCHLLGSWQTTLSYTTAAKYPLSADGKALCVSSISAQSGVVINNPILADVSGYNYMYVDVYNPQDENVKFYVNYIWNNNYLEIAPKEWTRVVMKKTEDGNFEMLKVSGKISGPENDKKTVFDSNPNNPQPTNLATLQLGVEDAANKTIYLGSFRAVNELPELPEGIVYATAPKVTLASSNYVVKGSTQKVEFATEDGEGAVLSVKVGVNGSSLVAVDDLDAFSFSEAGEYKFVTVLTKDGREIFRGESLVYSIESAGNEVLFTGNQYGMKINDIANWQQGTASFDAQTTIPGEATSGALKVTSSGALTGIEIHNPSIANVSEYKYVYFDVYNPQDRDIDFTVKYAWNYPVVKLYANHWTRIVLEVKSDGIYMRDAYVDQNGGTNKKLDMADYSFMNASFSAFGMTEGEYYLMGNVYAVNELPELPEGIKYNWNPEVEFSVKDLVVQGASEVVDVTVTNNDKNLPYALKVSVNGGEATAIEKGAEYEFAQAGEYKFLCEFTKDGNVVYTAEYTVVAVAVAGNEVLFTGNEYGKEINGLRDWHCGAISFDKDTQIPGEATSGALKVTSNGVVTASGILNGFDFTKPSIANVGEYGYLYFDVYNPQNRDIDFTVGFSWGYPVVKLYANHWTRIVLEVKSDGIYLRDAYTDQIGGTNKKTSIEGFNFTNVQFIGLAMEANEYFLMGNVYAVNELPELPAGIKYNWNPEVEFSVKDLVVQGTSEVVDVTVTNNDDNLAYALKVSVNGGEATAIEGGAAYEFAQAGEYKFLCEFTKDGNVVYTAEYTVFAVAAAGNEVLFTGNEYGSQINKFVDWFGGTVAYDGSVTVPGAANAGVLKLTCKEASAVGEGFYASSASIANVSEYKYVYVDIYNAQNRDIDFSVKYGWNYPVVKLYANHWTRIVLEVKSDGVYLRDAYTDQNGGTNKKTAIEGFNFTNVEFFAMGMNANEYLYMSNVYAVSELPELPAGIKYSWDTKVTLDLPVEVDVEAKTNVNAVVENGEGATVSVTVSVNGGEAVDIGNGSEYTFTEAGTHTFTVVVTLDGIELARAQKTVVVKSATPVDPEQPVDPDQPAEEVAKEIVLAMGETDGMAISGITAWQNASSVAYDASVNNPAEEKTGALKVTSNGGELTGFAVATPSIADVRTASYLYVDIYNPQDRELDFSISYEWAYPLVKLHPNGWTRIVIEVGREAGRYEVGGDGRVSNLYLIHAYSSQQGDLKQKISVYDGSFVNEEFIVFNMAAGEYVCVGNLYAVNKLPALPADVAYSVCARTDVNVDDFVTVGHKQVVNLTPVDFAGAELSATLSVNGGAATPFTSGTEYTFATAGEYKFTSVLTDGTNTVTNVKTVRALATAAGNELIALGSESAITASGVTGWQGATVSFSAEKNAMQLTATGGAVEGFNCGGFTATATITDVRGYKYVYFDVYNPLDRDLDLLISYAWGYPLVKLKANSWTRVVVTCGGYLLLNDAYSSQQGEVKTKVGIDDGNFTNQVFAIKGLEAGESVYVSSVYATGELPELPAGYVCGYKG
jgi:hypothetical protein